VAGYVQYHQNLGERWSLDAGLRLDIEAPTEKYPSMTGALQHYLIENQE
jgi:hypothetical protein